MTVRVKCRHPRCPEMVNAAGASLVCAHHRHTKPFCQCDQCKKPKPNARLRVKTLKELIAEGLVPR